MSAPARCPSGFRDIEERALRGKRTARLFAQPVERSLQILFPMAERFLDADTKRDLAAKFEARDAARGDRDRPGALLAGRARIG